MSVFTGNGDGTFGDETDYTDQIVGNSPTTLATGNLNGDVASTGGGSGTLVEHDRLDLVTVSPSDARVAVLLGERLTTQTLIDYYPSGNRSITYGNTLSVKLTVDIGSAPRSFGVDGSFDIYTDASTKPISIPLTKGSLSAYPSISGLGAGTHTVYAVYTGNYDFAAGKKSSILVVEVTPATLVVRPKSYSRYYGDDNPAAFENTYEGFVNKDGEDVVEGNAVFETEASRYSDVKSYRISLDQNKSSLSTPNYVFNYETGVLTVLPKVLNVSAVSLSRSYGTSNPELKYTTTGFVDGESEETDRGTGHRPVPRVCPRLPRRQVPRGPILSR